MKPEVGGVALLAALILLGVATQGLDLVRSLAALGFGAGVLCFAWAWQHTLDKLKSAPPPTHRQWAWQTAVFLAWLAALAALLWYAAGS